ncbi:heat-shock protein Hsp20 [Sphingobium sp. SCG-1]|uniref:Hsp20/alpha crystallin family protein n=1 Tax=Sphingobium sp. SCG-1 TaxID=2072936 RepID=UPI000CD6A1D9|nr:Hsp20/alpha crystallin family protein [Sphingobium sp. SCG-1]AUW58611.1 heat-shock protein Hsp20 [Sphingobium sp. SCG-1]
MSSDQSRSWMWGDAILLLNQVQRLHHQSFAPTRPSAGMANWEPPADVMETDSEVLVLIALPGVDMEQTEAFIEDSVLVVRGRRILPPELRTARIHRMELPQGRFERRLPLPAGRYEGVHRSNVNGCLLVTLQKAFVGSARR